MDLQTVATSKFETVDQCGQIPSPMLGAVSEAYKGESPYDVAVSWMKGQMVAASAFINVSQKMNEWQLVSLCRQMLEENPEIKMSEFILFCARLRSGHYGRFYGTINPMDILMAYAKFKDEREIDKARKWEQDEADRIAKQDEADKLNAISYPEWIRRKQETSRKEEAEKLCEDQEKK